SPRRPLRRKNEMVTRVNKNLVVALTLGGMVATTAAGILLVNNLPQKSPQKFVDQAEEFLARKPPDYIKAATFYQRAYGRAHSAGDTPTANKYLIKAGDLALQGGDAGMARKLWMAVVVADPTNIAAQEKVVSFYLDIAEMSNGSDLWNQVQSDAEKL